MIFGDSWSAAPLPLIGRDVEAAILDAALRSASAGHGQLVVVEGEAGIGKSRLLDDALARARGGGFEVLAGYADRMDTFFAANPGMQSRIARTKRKLRRGDVAEALYILLDLIHALQYDFCLGELAALLQALQQLIVCRMVARVPIAR